MVEINEYLQSIHGLDQSLGRSKEKKHDLRLEKGLFNFNVSRFYSKSVLKIY